MHSERVFNIKTANMPLLSSQKVLSLPAAHREALEWFNEHQGNEISWPSPMANGMFLINKAKGIHKPAGSQYALSIRQSLKGPYPDRDPKYKPDGSWTYQYFQEEPDPSKRDSMYTNVALLACQRDGVPVGVIRQVKPKPNPRYKVLGLAFVREWENGYFNLEGVRPAATTPMPNGALIIEPERDEEPFDPENLEDARIRVQSSIVRRQGQGRFRSMVLAAYGERCAISDCDLIEAVEAAHIYPYLGKETNVVTNGLPLRSDLHTLYDLGLIAIDSDSMKVLIGPKLYDTVYAALAGAAVRLPARPEQRPNRVALAMHLSWAANKWGP
jgi:putative restriction endonuclease